MSANRPKLIFLIQSFSNKTHFAYHAETVRYLSAFADIALLIERGADAPPDLPQSVTVMMPPSAFAPLRALWLFFMLLRLRLGGYRIAHVHYSFLGAILVGFLMRASGGKVFYWNAGMPWEYKRPRLREILERLGYRMIHTLVTASPALVDGYKKTYGLATKDIVVAANWIDVAHVAGTVAHVDREQERTRLGIPSGKKIALYARRLGEPWGAGYLPSVINELPETAHTLIVGVGPLRERIEMEIRANGDDERVTFLGALPQEELYRLLAIADVFLFPSHSEGLAHGLLEALAAGCPPVAFAVGGNVPVMERDAPELLIPPHDTHAFAEKVKDILAQDDATRAELGMRLKQAVLPYDKAHVLPEFRDVLLGGTKQPS